MQTFWFCSLIGPTGFFRLAHATLEIAFELNRIPAFLFIHDFVHRMQLKHIRLVSCKVLGNQNKEAP